MTAQKLRDTRLRLGIPSIKDAARIFDTPYTTWKGWETEESNPNSRRVPGIVVIALKFYEGLPKSKKPL